MKKFIALLSATLVASLVQFAPAQAAAVAFTGSNNAIEILYRADGPCASAVAFESGTKIRPATSSDTGTGVTPTNSDTFTWTSTSQSTIDSYTTTTASHTNFTPAVGTTMYMYYVIGASSNTVAHFCGPSEVVATITPNGGSPTTVLGYNVSPRIFVTDGNPYTYNASNFSNPNKAGLLYGSSSSSSSSSAASAAAAAAEAERKRQEAVAAARVTLTTILKDGKTPSIDDLRNADISINSKKTLDAVNAEIAKLPVAERTSIATIQKTVTKHDTVERFATSITNGTVFPNNLVEIGILSENEGAKTSIVNALRKLPAESIDTYDELKAAADKLAKVAADRRARTAAIIARISSR